MQYSCLWERNIFVTEIRVPVVGYEGIYEVSNCGRVYGLKRKNARGQIVNPIVKATKPNNRGYIQIRLSKDGKQKYMLLHRIVAEAFIPNPEGFTQVNHKDENKNNNSADNLEWCTNAYNRHYGNGMRKSIENHDYKQIAEKNKKTVLQLDKNGNVLNSWIGLKAAEEATGVGESNIRRCCYGRGSYAGGFAWKYA